MITDAPKPKCASRVKSSEVIPLACSETSRSNEESLKIASFCACREFEVTDGVIHGCPGLEVFNETMTNPDHPGYYHGVRIYVETLI